MKTNTWAAMGLGCLLFLGCIWAGVPSFSLLLGLRPPWHELRVMRLGWVGGFATVLLIALMAWGIRRIIARR